MWSSIDANACFASHVEYSIAESRFTTTVLLYETHLHFRDYPYLEYLSIPHVKPDNLNTLKQKRNILPYSALPSFTHVIH